ncbi:hypothetical protein GCM10007147_02830 [Nocardiopsis kunsanensis]|uniref:Uncharacterized protein n=1 Tax=Nocardiopsis kunsanensis TaxID=141693 RepID=A0A918X766_9ACTN|nr:hypothetical protein GCM10007147_02830 [Nocardiopsis kunsanensis]
MTAARPTLQARVSQGCTVSHRDRPVPGSVGDSSTVSVMWALGDQGVVPHAPVCTLRVHRVSTLELTVCGPLMLPHIHETGRARVGRAFTVHTPSHHPEGTGSRPPDTAERRSHRILTLLTRVWAPPAQG